MSNFWLYETEISAVFDDLKQAWEQADAPAAGWAYGQFWNLLMSPQQPSADLHTEF